MARSGVPTIVRVAVAAVAVAILVGAMAAPRLLGCFPPHDQADMIALYQADPLFAVVPEGGELVGEYANPSCDSGLSPRDGGGGSPGPLFAEVKRQYKTPTDFTDEQLREQFDRPAADAGWRIDPTEPHYNRVYCKQTGRRASYASVSAASYRETAEVPSAPAVEVILSASGDSEECFNLHR